MLAFLISAKLTENITNLDHAISQVSKGDFYTNIPVNSQDEVGSLTVNFNKMVVKIKSLVEEIYQKEKLKKKLSSRQFIIKLIRTCYLIH